MTEPIVQICGDGGVGKSVLAFDYLRSILRDPPIQFIGACHASILDEHWPGTLFATWRNTHDENLRKEPIGTIIERLKIASPSPTYPLLFLLLDGIDERDHEGAQRPVGQIIQFLEHERIRCLKDGTAPRVQLIVTARDKADFCHQWIREDLFGDGTSKVHHIELRVYSDEELSEITANHLPSEIAKRIRDSLEFHRRRSSPDSEDQHDVLGGDAPSISVKMLEALRHPPMLAALRRLDANTGIGVLNHDPSSCKAIAKLYLHWFAQKAIRRRRFRNINEVYELLNAIVGRCDTPAQLFSYPSDWQSAVLAYGGSQMEAQCLYAEAQSAGLVLKESQLQWRWRNEFVCVGIKAHAMHQAGGTG